MILLPRKLTRPHTSKLESQLSASLRDFQSEVSALLARIVSEPDSGPEKWFDLMTATSIAFAKMVVKVDHPMTRWGERLTDEYLNHTLNVLNLLNSVSASLSRLSRARNERSVDLKPDRSTGLTDIRPDSEAEKVILKALCLCRGIEMLSIGFVLSDLCGDVEPYMEIRKRIAGNDSAIVKDLDSRVLAVIMSRCSESTKMELRNSIEGLEQRSNNMFYAVLATRNKLMDNLRLIT